MVQLGNSDLEVFPLSLGGNVFGWTSDTDESFKVLDGYRAGGGNFIDTADAYSSWVPGHTGGESETVIGKWLKTVPRDEIVVATKVSQHPEYLGLSATNIRSAAEASLKRLGTDHIDLYYAHFDDDTVPLAETVAAFGELISAGLIRQIGVSNYSPERIEQWLSISKELNIPLPAAFQPHYNLVHRADVESQLVPIAERENISLVPYWALASGFLTGKYRSLEASGSSPRAESAAKYATKSGLQIIDALSDIANERRTEIASVAIAWLRQQPSVAAPIASASKASQLPALIAGATLVLSANELEKLDRVSEADPLTK